MKDEREGERERRMRGRERERWMRGREACVRDKDREGGRRERDYFKYAVCACVVSLHGAPGLSGGLSHGAPDLSGGLSLYSRGPPEGDDLNGSML